MSMHKYLLIILLFAVSCSSEPESDIIKNSKDQTIFIPELWNIQYIMNDNTSSVPSGIFGNWAFDKQVLSNFRENDNSIVLKSIDPSSGDINWEWNEYYNIETESTDGRDVFRQNNILHWKTKKRQYWIDLTNGQTVKRYIGEQSFSRSMRILNDSYYCIALEENTYPGFQTLSVFKGNFCDPSPDKILSPTLDTAMNHFDRLGGISHVIPFISNSDTLLSVVWQKIFPPGWNVQSYLGLYNLNEKSWVFNDLPLNKIDVWGNASQAIMYDNKIIIAIDKNIMCYDMISGEKKWEQVFNGFFSPERLEISENILVANCEDGNLYGIDSNSGNILWRGEGAGTSSLLKDRIMNGVVYFVGGSTGWLHAVDLYTGQTLWKLDPELYGGSEGYWSTTDFSCIDLEDDRNGYILVKNGLNIYCFEAVK